MAASAARSEQRRRGFRQRVVTGLLLLLPLLVTFWVVRFLFLKISSLVTPFAFRLIGLAGVGDLLQDAWVRSLAYLASFILAIGFLYLLGLIGGHYLGQRTLSWFELQVQKIPFVRSIYGGTRQVITAFSRDKTERFQRAVLIEYPRPGVWTLAFLMNDDAGDFDQVIGRRLVAVFIPTTPNPTSGWLLYVPAEDVHAIDVDVDDVFKLILSAGVLTPVWKNRGDAEAQLTAGPQA